MGICLCHNEEIVRYQLFFTDFVFVYGKER